MKRGLEILALAPLVGCTDLLIKATSIGISGLLLITLCGLLLAPLRNRLSIGALLLAAALIGAILATGLGLLLQPLSSELAGALELYIPLLVLPCLALTGDQQANTSSGLRAGLKFAILAVLLGALREPLGHGSLLAHADWLLGPGFTGWHWSPVLPLLTQAAGGFILLGLLLALSRQFDQDHAR